MAKLISAKIVETLDLTEDPKFLKINPNHGKYCLECEKTRIGMYNPNKDGLCNACADKKRGITYQF